MNYQRKKNTVGIYTFGCRLNIYESDGILKKFKDQNYEIIPFEDAPEIAIINTCTLTERADSKNRSLIRSILKKNPNSKVIVTGCYAQTNSQEISKISGVYAVIGNEKKSQIFEIINEINHNVSDKIHIYSSGPLETFENSKKRKKIDSPFDYKNVIPFGHTRAYLKIQDGCDRKCSYCKIPQARGCGVSRNSKEILIEIKYLDSLKIPEIVLTGVNIGWYRFEKYRFTDLLEEILDNLYYSRLRISSIEPSDVNEKLAKISLHPKFCNFLHIPLQSGSDRILRLMKRSYNSKTYKIRVEKVLAINPRLFLGTDVICGFPSETDDDFRQTYNLLEELPIINIHCFPFSLREGTKAEQILKQNPSMNIDKAIIKNRIQSLIELKNRKLLHYAKNIIGEIRTVIVENLEPIESISDDFLKIQILDKKELKKGDIVKVQITGAKLERAEVKITGKVIE